MLDKYKKLRNKINAYNFALSTISFDAETIAPKDAFEYRSKMVNTLVGEVMAITKSDEYYQLVRDLSKVELDEYMTREIALELKKLDKNKNVPKELLLEYSMLSQKCSRAWEEAKEARDYNLFKDALHNLIKMIKRIKGIQDPNTLAYDQLLDDNEEGYNMRLYDEFFQKVKDEIIPLIKEVTTTPSIDFIPDKKIQKDFVYYIIDAIHFDLNKGLLSESLHPFTSHTHSKDVRLTVRYDDTFESILSALHELGHAMYNQQISSELDDTFLKYGVSPGIHESQSRFYENIIGRSKGFWKNHYSKLQEMFPEMNQYSLDEFYASLNRVENTLIRVQADELTYPVHILIRYEIEKYIFSDEFDINQLHHKWNDLYEEYLGIRPKNDAEGILQDIHWSWGYFGYFPTYALGSAIAAQIYYTSTMDIEQAIQDNDIVAINEYLKEHIHQYGSLKTPEQIIQGISGEPFNADYYVKYLKEKYSRR